MRIILIITISLIASGMELFGQSIKTVEDDIPQYPHYLYKKATYNTQNLYSGRRYFLNDPISEEHQFFIDRKWQTGSLVYDGQQFDSIPMMYDIHKDQLVIRDLENNFLLLIVDRLASFNMYGHYFRRLVSREDIPGFMNTGFYDIRYDGQTKFIVQRKKDRQEKVADLKVIPLYEIKDSYYIFRHNNYWPVKSKKSVLALFPEHARELKRIVRKEGISYRKNREQAILEMVKYYDEIIK